MRDCDRKSLFPPSLCISFAGVKLPDSIYGPLSGSIPVLPLLMSGLVISTFTPLPPTIRPCIYLVDPSRTASERARLVWAGIRRSAIKLFRSDRNAPEAGADLLLDGAKFGIKRSNLDSSLYISQQATNDLMDQDFH